MRIFIYLTIIVLPFIFTVYAKPLSKEEKQEIVGEVKEAVEDRRIDSFKISPISSLKVDDINLRITNLQLQIKIAQLEKENMLIREMWVKGIKEKDINKYDFNEQTKTIILKDGK